MPDYWSWNNAVDAPGTVITSAQGAAGDLALANLLDPSPSMVWRAGAMPATLEIALPAISAVSIVGLFGLNHLSLGTVTLTLTSDLGGTLWTREFQPNETGRRAVFVLRDGAGALAPVAATRLTISAEIGAPLEIGRVWIGDADWTPIGHGPDGSSWGGVDLSQKSRTPRTGAVHGVQGSRLRTMTANYEMLSPAEYAGSLFEMDDLGTLRQMLFVPDPAVYDPHRFAVLGTLDDIPTNSWTAYMLAGRPITITEAG